MVDIDLTKTPMDAEPRARTPIPYGVAARRKNTWLMVFSKAFIFLGLLGLSGCATFNKPLSEEQRDELIRSWDLPTPNPWFWSE